MKDILNQTKFIPQAFLLTLLVMLYEWILQTAENGKKRGGREWLKRCRFWPFLFCLAWIFTSTVFLRQKINPYHCVFMHFGFRKDMKWNKEIIENILLFIPLSFLYLQACKPSKPWKSALIMSAGITSFIELSQLLFWLGNFQFADLFHNIIGGMIGCGIWYVVDKIRRRYLQKNPQKEIIKELGTVLADGNEEQTRGGT